MRTVKVGRRMTSVVALITTIKLGFNAPGSRGCNLARSILFRRCGLRFFLRNFFAIVVVDDLRDVRSGLTIRRYSAILFHAHWSRVICRQSFDQVEVVAFEKLSQVAGSAIDIGLRVERILYAQLSSCARHKLHQTLCALGRNRSRIESAFGKYHAVNQIGIKTVRGAGGTDDLFQIRSRSRFRWMDFRCLL